MKYFLATILVLSARVVKVPARYLLAAENDNQARELLECKAMNLGENYVSTNAKGIHIFGDGSFCTKVEDIVNITPATFQELSSYLPTLGHATAGDLTSETEPDERVKTIALRLGRELKRRGAVVPHGQLLHAVAASLGHKDWAVLKAAPREEFKRAKAKTKLRDAQAVSYAARVDAIWLAEGDTALAAALLNTTEASLMQSFKSSSAAELAWCGRPANWVPEDSLMQDYGASVTLRERIRIDVTEGYEGYVKVQGVVDGNEVFSASNHIFHKWYVGSSTCFPSDILPSRAMLACYTQVLREVVERQRVESETAAAVLDVAP